ncbi:CDGSH iron-sulfur domain-containing protein [Salinigranum salinum]|uniref:CDGSH iron-sulfur domain-containing protein n=1 Tax=Salinigranum salinum TaxID=1364937 RepID=UPI0012606105|nr:CDGSH iron-sulfur domain-containing protein [Salinigranum salinum]
MGRNVTHVADEPFEITVDDVDEEYGDVAVCLCGLSDEQPFCDGSHRRTEGEVAGVQYKYVDGERHVVEFVYGDDRDGTDDQGDGADDRHDAE